MARRRTPANPCACTHRPHAAAAMVNRSGAEAPGRRSTFTVRLPSERLSAVPALAETEDAELGLRNRTIPVRILAAEDHEVNRLVLATMLERVGIDATLVGDGQQAIDGWKAGEWDLILLDVQMPVMDGPSAARTIRSAEAARGRRRTPVVALTANAMTHQVAAYRARRHGRCARQANRRGVAICRQRAACPRSPRGGGPQRLRSLRSVSAPEFEHGPEPQRRPSVRRKEECN